MIENAISRTEQNVSRLHTFLEEICAEPSKYSADQNLVHALSRQDRLGAYESTNHNVRSSSRSSIERVCNKLLPGGYAKFNAMRLNALTQLKAAKTATERSTRPRKRTTERYREEAADFECIAMLRLVDCWHMTSAIYRALVAGRRIASDSRNSSLVERWRREEAVILSMLSLSKELVVRSGSAEEKWAEELRGISS